MTIFSVHDNDLTILESISKLYLNNEWFDYDPTFSKGILYPNKKPLLKSDIKKNHGIDFVSDFKAVPLKNDSLKSIVIDPPFLIAYKDRIKHHHNLSDRFSYYNRERDLLGAYFYGLCEMHRILKWGGILVFKCQDITNNHFFCTHIELYNLAKSLNFICKDLFIKHNKSKIYNPKLKQRHSLKTHCYYYVFKKNKGIA